MLNPGWRYECENPSCKGVYSESMGYLIHTIWDIIEMSVDIDRQGGGPINDDNIEYSCLHWNFLHMVRNRGTKVPVR